MYMRIHTHIHCFTPCSGGSSASSCDVTPVAEWILTEAMVDEERRLREEGSASRESSIDRDQEVCFKISPDRS